MKNERFEKQFRSNQKLNRENEFVVDFDNFLKLKIISDQYSEIIIVSSDEYFETIDVIVKLILVMSVKMIMINISN